MPTDETDDATKHGLVALKAQSARFTAITNLMYLALIQTHSEYFAHKFVYAIVILPPYISHWGVILMYPTHSD